MTNNHRRSFVKAIACLPLLPIVQNQTKFRTTGLHEMLLLAKNNQAMHKLGVDYLQQLQRKVTYSQLEHEFKDHIDYQEGANFEDVALAITESIKNNFENDIIVETNGWQFSQTEAYFAALSVLV